MDVVETVVAERAPRTETPSAAEAGEHGTPQRPASRRPASPSGKQPGSRRQSRHRPSSDDNDKTVGFGDDLPAFMLVVGKV